MDWDEFWRINVSNPLELFSYELLILFEGSVQKIQYFFSDFLMISLKLLMNMFLSILYKTMHLPFLISKLIFDSKQKWLTLRLGHLKIAAESLGVCNFFALHVSPVGLLLPRLIEILLDGIFFSVLIIFGRTIKRRAVGVGDAFILGEETIQIKLLLHFKLLNE